jgi:hypothetical protein
MCDCASSKAGALSYLLSMIQEKNVFVSFDHGILNLNDVTKIERLPKGGTHFRLKDGNSATSAEEYERVVEGIGPVIPDATGTRALYIEIDDGVLYKSTEPVIGWVISASGPVALTPSGGRPDYLLYSDGSVEHLQMASYKSVDELVEVMMREVEDVRKA